MGIEDPGLITLVKQLFARDGMINREDMMQILNYTVTNSFDTLSTMDFNDLKTIVNQDSTYFKMPNYVKVLAGDIVNGSPANLYFTGGQAVPSLLGNLVAGSSAVQMDELIGKWFLGTDLPAAQCDWLATAQQPYVPVQYEAVNGVLYGSVKGVPTPVLNDAQQGDLGDCYLISSLVGIANVNPTAIENMIQYNGLDNGTPSWTVRFYSNGVANYVTVNNELPVLPQSVQFTQTISEPAGALNYNGTWTITNVTSPSNVLWVSLIEKAYAQWNEVGLEQHGVGYDGYNAYEPIAGGYMQYVYDQVLGATDYSQAYYLPASGFGSTPESVLQQALAMGDVVTIGTIPGSNSTFTPDNLLVEGHAYTVVGYNSTTKLYTLHNPWGNAPQLPGGPPTQPVGLTWANLTADCTYFATAMPYSLPFSSSIVAVTTSKATKPAITLPKAFNGVAAAGAWYAMNSAEANSRKDAPPPATQDLALLAYLS
jgi:hypothetical protein